MTPGDIPSGNPAGISDRSPGLPQATPGYIAIGSRHRGYAGELEREVANLSRHRQIDLEIIKRSNDVRGFKVLPKRWSVDRTFGWLVQSRRLIWDYEVGMDHAEALIHLSMIKRMLPRIAE